MLLSVLNKKCGLIWLVSAARRASTTATFDFLGESAVVLRGKDGGVKAFAQREPRTGGDDLARDSALTETISPATAR